MQRDGFDAFHRRIESSSVETRMNRPVGEYLTYETGGLPSAKMVLRHLWWIMAGVYPRESAVAWRWHVG